MLLLQLGRKRKEEKGFMDHPVKQSGTYLMENYLQLKEILNTEGTKHFVCKHCNSKLNSIQDLKNQVSLLRNEIKPYLEAFQSKAGESSMSVSIAGEKRARSDTMVGIVQSDHAWSQIHQLQSHQHQVIHLFQ